MERLLFKLGLVSKPTSAQQGKRSQQFPIRPLNPQEFEQWCKDLNVSVLTNKQTSFTVLIGNHEKTVDLHHMM